MSELKFNWRDILKAARLAFNLKKIWVYLFSLFLAYIIYQFLVYLSLLLWNPILASKAWKSYGIIPVSPFLNDSFVFPMSTLLAVILGTSVAFIIFLLADLTVSKVVYEQLKGDDSYPLKEAFKFAKNHLKSVVGSIGFLIGTLVFLSVFPLFVALMGQTGGGIGSFILMIASSPLFMIPAFFMGLFMAFLVGAFIFGFFLTPAIIAATADDLFETVYQLFSAIWNQPWRLIFYQGLLFLSKAFWVSILTLLSLAGFQLILLPSSLIVERYSDIIKRASRFIGSEGVINQVANWMGEKLPFQFDILYILSGNPQLQTLTPWSLDLSALFAAISSIFLIAFLISYFFSFGSAGNLIIYLLIRNKITGENLLSKRSAISKKLKTDS